MRPEQEGLRHGLAPLENEEKKQDDSEEKKNCFY